MKDLKKSGKLTVNSKWKELFQWLKDESAFRDMIGQPGSTPMELYRDLIADLELEIYRQGKQIQELLKVFFCFN